MSGKIFGNEKVVEVALALTAESEAATAQQIAKRTGIDHSMVRDVLVRLAEASVVLRLPRASARAPQYYEADPADPVWVAVRQLTRALAEKYDLNGGEPVALTGAGPARR